MNKGAKYADIRIQRKIGTSIDTINGDVTNCIQNEIHGAGIRVISTGGWGFSSTFNVTEENLLKSAEEAISLAKICKVSNPVKLAETQSVEDHIALRAIEDPREVALEEKASLLQGLNKQVLNLDKRVVNVRLQYTDSVDNLVFRNSEGTVIDVSLPEIETNFWVTSREKGISQWARNRKSGRMGFEFTKEVDLYEQGKDAVKRSIDLLKGKPTPKGKQIVVMDPSAVGVFIHEAFGHADEADSVFQRRSFLYGLIGKTIASSCVNLYSDPTLQKEVGSYPYDSEGTRAKYTVLVEGGIFKSYMHSRETAAVFETEPTGNARAQDFSLPPIVRMNNLCLKPGEWKYNEIIEDTKQGILIEGSRGGMEDPERGGFQFSAQNCYLIDHGEVVSTLRDVSITGMTIETMKSIDAVADNFYLHPGHCGKGEPGVMQSVCVTDGGPYIRVRDILVGGVD